MKSGSAVFLINSLGTGGAERAVVLLGASLRRAGHEIRILCLERPALDAIPAGLDVTYLSRLRSSLGPVLKLLLLPFLAFRLAAFLRRERIRVVISHLFRANFVNVLAKRLARSRHKAILVNHTRVSRLRDEGLQGWINWKLCRMLYPRADLVASVSAGAAAECAGMLGLQPERSIILNDPIDTAAWETAAKRAQPSQAIAAVGRLVGLKRFADLIDAFARLAEDFPRLELRLVGDGPERSDLENRAARTAVLNRIRFLGRMADPAAAVAGCLAFVSASETEGFGMAIVEALAAGVPVVASDCAYGPREILAPETDSMRLLDHNADLEIATFGILYPVGSVNSLEKALRRLIQDTALREKLSRLGLQRAAAFSVEHSTAAYERLFQE